MGDVRRNDLYDEFSKFGDLVRADIPPNKGIAFVEFESKSDAQTALRKMDNKEVAGRRISVQQSRQGPSKAWRSEGVRDLSPGRRSPKRRSRSRSRSRKRSRSRSRSRRKQR